MGLCVSSVFAWGRGCREPVQCSQTCSEPVLETQISPRPAGCAGNAQPAGACHPSRVTVSLCPTTRPSREGLFNMIFFLPLQNTQTSSFFPARRTKKKGRGKHDSVSIFRGGKELLDQKWTLKHYETYCEERFTNASLFAH